jgi:hypothetical protein
VNLVKGFMSTVTAIPLSEMARRTHAWSRLGYKLRSLWGGLGTVLEALLRAGHIASQCAGDTGVLLPSAKTTHPAHGGRSNGRRGCSGAGGRWAARAVNDPREQPRQLVRSAGGGRCRRLDRVQGPWQLLRMLWQRFLNTFRCQVRLQNCEREIYDAVIAFIARQKMVRSAVLLAKKKKVKLSWMERVKIWARRRARTREARARPQAGQHLRAVHVPVPGQAHRAVPQEGCDDHHGLQPPAAGPGGPDADLLGARPRRAQSLMQQAIDEEFEQSQTDDLTIWVRTAGRQLARKLGNGGHEAAPQPLDRRA